MPGKEASGLQAELEAFLESPSSLSPASILGLLTSSPLALRPAILDYYATLLDSCAGLHYNSAARDNFAANLPNLRYLSANTDKLVSDCPVWASLLAQWALAVLGDLSSKYSEKVMKTAAAPSLNATLSVWLDCPAISLLVDLVRKSIDSLLKDQKNHEKTELVVSVLLESSSKHAPHYDWVVAHVGACFPETVIRRVLVVGLKDFASSAINQSKKDGKFNIAKVPKMQSVVNILGHLAAGDANEGVIQKSLAAMIVDSLKQAPKMACETEVATVPFVLNLCSLDENHIPALTSGLYRMAVTSTTENDDEDEDILIERVAEYFDKWEEKYFTGDNTLLNMIIHLIIQSKSRELLRLLLDLGKDVDDDEEEEDSFFDVSDDVRNGARAIVDVLTAELFASVHAAPRHSDSELPFLEDFCDNFDHFLANYFLSKDLFQRRAMQQLTNIASLYRGRTLAVKVVVHSLDHAKSDEDLGLLFEFLKDTELWVSNIVKEAMKQRLKSRNSKPLPFLKNLGTILHYQSLPKEEQKVKLVSQFKPVLSEHHGELLPLLSRNLLVPHVLKIFKFVPFDPNKASVALMHRTTHCLVHTVFSLLKNDSSDEERLDATERNRSVAACAKILARIGANPVGLPIALRFLLEGAIRSEFAPLFGGKFKTSKDDASLRKTVKLMEENLKFGAMPTHPLGAATAFHAGVIGEGKRPTPKDSGLTPDEIEYNQFAWLSVLFKICHAHGRKESKEATKHLALLLVEVVSPDAMYNGLPWPEEEFIKVTIERDLIIAKTFEDHPLIWKVLRGLAEARPSLCYASVLLRAQMAVQMNYWQACVASKASERPKQLATLKTLLEVMSVGQFLPHPLDCLSEVVGVMHSFHVHCVLVDVWNYMRDNVPSPLGFASNADDVTYREFEHYKNYKQYCERLRVIMIEHLDEVPNEFRRFFVDEAKKQEANLKLAMEY